MANNNKRKKQNTKEADYQPSEQDRVALDKYIAKRGDQLSARISVTDNGAAPSLSIDPHTVIGLAQMMQALATGDLDFANGILAQLANAGSKGQDTDEASISCRTRPQ
jgi:hypothetical protein